VNLIPRPRMTKIMAKGFEKDQRRDEERSHVLEKPKKKKPKFKSLNQNLDQIPS
jgi:hypothetical protein